MSSCSATNNATILIDALIKIFVNPWPIISQQIVSIYKIDIDVDENVSMETMVQITNTISDIIRLIDNNIHTETIDTDQYKCINQKIYKLFIKYYNIIMEMSDPIKYETKTESDEEEQEEQEPKQVTDFQIKRGNDLKWQIICEIIEKLMHHLFENGIIESNLLWIDIIKELLLKNTGIQTKRKIILLSRILISFGSKLIQQNQDKTLIMDCKNFLNQFLIEFVPSNYKRYQEYNDLHTLQDINIVFDLLNRDHSKQNKQKMEQINNDQTTENKKNENIDKKKRKRRRKRRKKSDIDNDDNKDNTDNKRDKNVLLLSNEIESYYNKTRVKGKEKQNKESLINHIGKLWKKVLFSTLPSLKSQLNYKEFDGRDYVYLFGSSATKLDECGSDIDLYLTTPKHLSLSIQGEWQLFEQLSKELEINKYKNKQNRLKIINIFNCTVPIIKINDEINNIKVDISFGKQIENAKIVKLLNLFCDYKNDLRIRQLIISIKYWSRQRQLNDATKNKLNSFGFVLLVIKYLQNEKILPMLRKTKNRNHDQIEFLSMKSNQNKKMLSLGDLMFGFFVFYYNFNFHQYSVSLFKNKVLKQNRNYWDLNNTRMKGERLTFIIEDPIQTNYNCSKNVRERTANLMRIEFLRCMLILKYGDGDFNHLCKSI